MHWRPKKQARRARASPQCNVLYAPLPRPSRTMRVGAVQAAIRAAQMQLLGRRRLRPGQRARRCLRRRLGRGTRGTGA